jgi:hypothetical protein
MKKYLIELKYFNGSTEQLELTTDKLEWSIEQYQRNRPPFEWDVIN